MRFTRLPALALLSFTGLLGLPAQAVKMINETSSTSSTRPSKIDQVTNSQGTGGWWPSDTPGPRTPLPSSATSGLQSVSAPLELLVMVRLLREEVNRSTLRFSPGAAQAISDLLRPLTREATLGSTKAASIQQALLEQLSQPQANLLQQRRAALERSVQNLMARARFAAPDGPVNRNRIRYHFMIPDGPSVVKALEGQPNVNPYRASPLNAQVLTQLLDFLQNTAR